MINNTTMNISSGTERLRTRTPSRPHPTSWGDSETCKALRSCAASAVARPEDGQVAHPPADSCPLEEITTHQATSPSHTVIELQAQCIRNDGTDQETLERDCGSGYIWRVDMTSRFWVLWSPEGYKMPQVPDSNQGTELVPPAMRHHLLSQLWLTHVYAGSISITWSWWLVA